MYTHYVVWLALSIQTGVGQEDHPAAAVPTESAQLENGPLLLVPKQLGDTHQGDSNQSSAALSEELERLKQEQEALRTVLTKNPADLSGPPDVHAESTRRLRQQLDQLTAEIARKQKSKGQSGLVKPEVQPVPSPSTSKSSGPVSRLTTESATTLTAPSKASSTNAKPVDPLALGQVLLRIDDYEGAIAAFRAVDLTKLHGDDRAYAQYMLATALRAAGRVPEALPVYREVANSRADTTIADFARWQLSTIQWQQELESQLATLRQRRKLLQSAASTQLDTIGEIRNSDAGQDTNKENQ